MGKDGLVKLFPEEIYENLIDQVKFLFFQINGSRVPFEIEKVKPDTIPWLVKFTKITGPEEASILVNKDVYIEKDKVNALNPESEWSMIGYTVYSSNSDSIGIIKDVEQHPEQVLLVIEFEDKTYRLPLHPDVVEGIEEESQKIVFSYTLEDIKILTGG